MLVGERDIAGDTDAHAAIGRELERAGLRAYDPAGARARLERFVIEHGLHQDEMAQLARVRFAPAQQGLPRQRRVATGEGGLGGLGDRRERAVERRDRDVAVLRALRQEIERAEHAGKTGIGSERAEQRLRRDQLIGKGLQLFRREEQKAIARKIFTAAGYAGVPFDPNRVSIWLGDLLVASEGTGLVFDEERAHAVLEGREVVVTVDLNQGNADAVAWGCDLSYDYVRINGNYRT